jgi:NADH-ubiquinone oxidoreductase chain 5
MFLGYGSSFWNNSIYFFNKHFLFIEVEYINFFIKNLPIILCFFNMFFFFILYSKFYILKYSFFKFLNNFSVFFYYAFFFNKIYNFIYECIFLHSYVIQVKFIDKGLLELIGPYGMYKIFKLLNLKLNNFMPSQLFIYLFLFFFNFNLFLFCLIFFISISNIIIVNYFGLVIIYIFLFIYIFSEDIINLRN